MKFHSLTGLKAMVHRPKIITLNQQIQRDYHVQTSGAASKILARLTKQLFGKAIKDKDLTPAQRSDVLGLIITDSMERDKKLFEQDDAPPVQALIEPTTSNETNSTNDFESVDDAIDAIAIKKPPVRGKNKQKRGRQADNHRQAITVSKGKVVNIYLEPEFDAAADKVTLVTGNNKIEWFKRVVNSNTDLNPTAALRLAIVKAITDLLPVTHKT